MKNFYITFALVLLTSTLGHASEFILRVQGNGQYIVSASNQTQTNTYNTYQFYNLYGGSTQVKVVSKWNKQIIFKNTVSIPNESQVVAELDPYGNMTIISTNPLSNSSNGWGENVGSVNYGNSGNHCGTVSNNQNGYYQGQNTSNVYFNQFLSTLKNESFDSNRLKNAKVYAANTNLSANQIKEIASTFTFDSNRLDWAKSAYSSCFDKGNYFLLQNTFTFSSNYSDLQSFISTQ
ncbi:DUF4476 domain-containing protein [Fluviicola taffensis]|uniref:DUF4476 domain-containing protein n=1 Tax=Fluviicola taffensis (strain DSM 16823 / NCIMB 13979 / RW262) TaxID=755732 RepID=F2ICZ8_FLUTR|nr:DUF4476 domain-containing protein [Fluviicola taffensis]AEA44392.1 hypothetical protein Fluta_2406 [Fluviicola taffensis DSM 16823]